MTRARLIRGGKRAIHWGLAALVFGIVWGGFFWVGLALVLMALGQLAIHGATIRLS